MSRVTLEVGRDRLHDGEYIKILGVHMQVAIGDHEAQMARGELSVQKDRHGVTTVTFTFDGKLSGQVAKCGGSA